VTTEPRTLLDRIEELRRLVEDARSMPMSASVVVNRGELLALVDELSEAARGELAEAAGVLSAKDDVVGQGHRKADELLAEAHGERQRLASESEVLQHARGQADAELAAARQEADALRKEVDDYVDTKLAGFEVALERSLETVRRGRERLATGDGTAATGLGTEPVDEIGDVELPPFLER
jgi:cell division septum initiation protein DivIVA